MMQKRPKPEKVAKKTAVYVTGLPSDVTAEELEEVFKKAGVFLIDPITSLPKIKLYKRENGDTKGDALVIYLRAESVALACQLLDDTPLRFGDKNNIKVEPAVFQEKEKPKDDELIVDKKLKQRAYQKMTK